MQARLSAVQQVLVLVPVASLTIALLGRPYPENRHYAAARAEVVRFDGAFQREAAERSLLSAAQAQGATALTTLQGAVSGRGVPALKIADGAPAVLPLAVVSIESLEAALERSQPGRTLTIGVPELSGLGEALAWRLAHRNEPGPYTLQGVELKPGAVDAKDLETEREAAEARLALLKAQADVDQANKRVEYEDRIFEARRKRRLPWKILAKSIEARKEARAALDEKSAVLRAAEERYQALVTEAQKKRELAPLKQVPEHALAQVSLKRGDEAFTLDIPVQLSRKEVPVPSLGFRDFSATREAGLWDVVKGQDARKAIATIEAHFNWHYRHIEIAGVRVGGMTVLQLLPCALPLVLLWLVMRIRAAGSSYSPFTTEVRGTLPRVGLKSRGLDALALVALPLLGAASSATALLFVGQVPVLPAVAGAVSVVLGGYAFSKLGDLQGLVASVEHSHSYPPPHHSSTSTHAP